MKNFNLRSLLVLLSFLYCEALYEVGKNYSLVLVGGGLYDNNTDIWERIVDLGGGVGKARFGVISAASEVKKYYKMKLLKLTSVSLTLIFRFRILAVTKTQAGCIIATCSPNTVPRKCTTFQ